MRPRAAAFALAALALAPSPARADSCAVSADPVLFGPYDSLSPSGTAGVGSVDLFCDSAAEATVELARNSSGPRTMRKGADALLYELYRDAARQSVWGDGTAAAGVSASGPQARLPVYGLIPAGQKVPAGDYTDVVTILVRF